MLRLRYRLRFLVLCLLGRLDDAMRTAIEAEKRLGPGVLMVGAREALLVRAGLSAARLLRESPPPSPLPELPTNVISIGARMGTGKRR